MSHRIHLLSVAAVVAIAVSADSAAQDRKAIPDFSGIWAHPFLTGFEPPASGPGPVLNRSRRPDGVANFQQLVGDYTNPILKPHAAEIVKKHGEQSLAGVGYRTPSNQCRPQGVPYILWDFTMQFLPAADHVTMVYRQGNETRHIRMNQSHPAVLKPSWYGDSVGRYEGDTLVIDTVGVKVGPYPMLDMYGTPFSEKLHVVERYRLVDYDEAKDEIDRNFKENTNPMGNGAEFDRNYRGKMLQLHFTVEDDEVFTTPWTATITYWPNLVSWPEQICAENPREYYNNKDTDLPVAGKPDF
jgi:hypothetical protein